MPILQGKDYNINTYIVLLTCIDNRGETWEMKEKFNCISEIYAQFP